EAARMDCADEAIACELDSVDGFVEFGDHDHAFGAHAGGGNQHAVIAARVCEADARARPAAEAVGVEPFERGGALKIAQRRGGDVQHLADFIPSSALRAPSPDGRRTNGFVPLPSGEGGRRPGEGFDVTLQFMVRCAFDSSAFMVISISLRVRTPGWKPWRHRTRRIPITTGTSGSPPNATSRTPHRAFSMRASASRRSSTTMRRSASTSARRF